MYRPTNIQFVRTNTTRVRRMEVGRENIREKQPPKSREKPWTSAINNDSGHEQEDQNGLTSTYLQKGRKKGQSSDEPSPPLAAGRAELHPWVHEGTPHACSNRLTPRVPCIASWVWMLSNPLAMWSNLLCNEGLMLFDSQLLTMRDLFSNPWDCN